MAHTGVKSVATLIVVAVVAAVVWRVNPRPKSVTPPLVPGEVIPLAIEVLNASAIDGLARRATHYLRSQGLDVVSYGSAAGEPQDSTVLRVRRGDTTAAIPVRDALGFGRIVLDPDARLLLDVTVVLGRDAAQFGRYP
ncbi:MAG TPA: LytR C-terminal domain-containing protein [Gemmatimonadales bacterium]